MERAFFPLDEELGLWSTRLTPHAHACLVRQGAWMPFEKAAQELGFLLKVTVSEPTARRHTQAAGKAYVTWQTQAVERLEQETPEPPQGPEKLFFSVDGAMVPLVGGEWTEVKTMTIGEIETPLWEQGEWVVHSRQHSYFSRVAEANDFRRLALVESHRRGVERAQVVAAVTDGAEWEQGCIDFHCSDAVRILDFPHTAERVHGVGQALWEAQGELAQTWVEEQLQALKQQGPAEVLAEWEALYQQHPEVEVLRENLAYLEKREAHLHYPDYQAQGLPIGSGAMESGNKVVVEARLKGAGMHWALPHLNPMLALRNILCSDRWEEAWPQIETGLRQTERQRKQEQRAHKHLAGQPTTALTLEPKPESPASVPLNPAASVSSTPEVPPSKLKQPINRPAANHPWRRSPIGRAQFLPSKPISIN